MKTAKMLTILVLVLGLVGSASAVLVAHYEFEGNADDSSGNNLHGSLAGGATTTVDAERGNVLSLGGGDYVDCGDDALFDITDSITVAAWIKVDTFNKNFQAAVTKGDETWKLTRSGGANSVEFCCNLEDAGFTSADGSVNVDDGQWHHVAGVYDGSKVDLYVDTVLDNSEPASGTISTDTSPVMIGQNAGWPGRWWIGLVDDVRIYNNALTASEIADIAMGGTDGVADYDWIISGNNMYSGVSGNVGIGTNNPEHKLEVVGDTPEDTIMLVVNQGGGDGIVGASGEGDGVVGESLEGAGLYGMSITGPGVVGIGAFAPGVMGGNAISEAIGLLGIDDGVYGESTVGYAGNFKGNVKITGRITKGSGSFLIDHPLDPENKYLQHSFVESPDMMNIYNGIVTLDENGQAAVKLPSWFEALNKDFRYQLTCIGGFAPVYIAEKISDKRFKISGGKVGMEVSWQVTGIRRDPYADKNRVAVEEDKSPEERGYYLHPAAYGLPEEKSIETVRNPRLSEIRELAKKRIMSSSAKNF